MMMDDDGSETDRKAGRQTHRDRDRRFRQADRHNKTHALSYVGASVTHR